MLRRSLKANIRKNAIPLYTTGIILCLFFTFIFLYVLLNRFGVESLIPKPPLPLPDKLANEMLEKCQGSNDVCYSNEFAKLAKVEPLDVTLSVFDRVQEMDEVARGCHLIAHSISTEETLKDLSQWEETLSRLPTDKCTGGFMHGVFEARKAKDPTLSINEETIPQLCRVVEEKAKNGNDQDCSHIMGHLLVVEHDGNLTRANETCGKLDSSLQYECFSGVYMENETRDGIVDHGLGKHIPWNDETTMAQQKLCEAADGVEAQACWRELSHMFVFITRDYPPDVYNLCALSGDAELTKDCYFHGVGIIVSSFQYNPANVELICKPYETDPQDYSKCIGVGVGSLLMSTPQFADRAAHLCQSAPFRFREGCFEYMSNRLAQLVPAEDLAIYCKDVPYPFQKRCEYPYL